MPILIADPDEASRKHAGEALRRVGFSTLEAESGEEAIAVTRRDRPRVAVLEVCLPGICGYEVCHQLRDEFADRLAIVFVSATRTEPYDRVGGLLLGANDYLGKPFDGDEFAARVRMLAERLGHNVLSGASGLTPREGEVYALLAQGLDQEEIARRLFISPKTVATHIEHVLRKLGVRSRAQAVALAYRGNPADDHSGGRPTPC
jgi:DNA-binding NarL/FixJ family response regulator